MSSYFFKVVIEDDQFPDGKKAYHAYCPALKGCHTFGHSIEEAIKNIQEAVLCHVESLLKDGEPIPAEIVKIEESIKATIETGITVTV